MARMSDPHPHDPDTGKARTALAQRFRTLMDRAETHVRVDYHDGRQFVKVVGTAEELHGPVGVCSCCPRRRRLTIDGDEVGA
jgi:hypothetical protein